MNRMDYMLKQMRDAESLGWGTELVRAKRKYIKWRKEYEVAERERAREIAFQVRFQQLAQKLGR